MDADRPITRREDDRLGFTPVAEHLARVVVSASAEDGLVFGIEGKWGSGKSTLINLTIEAIKNSGSAAPEVIAFSPWLVGDRDELLRSLFNELAAAAIKIDPLDEALQSADVTGWLGRPRTRFRDEHWKLKQKERLKKSIAGKLDAFGRVVGSLGRLARAAGSFGVPGSAFVGTAVERSGEAVRGFVQDASIPKRKAELVEVLKLLSRRIVVFIDDLDRLEPREASEVLRLIRAVADFPNVIYVLSYDPEVVAKTLTKAVQVDDGAAFLEKIVQVSFRVPRPEAFDLRRWFQAEIYKLFASDFDAVEERQQALKQRLAHAIDVHGGRYLQTPRDVVRTLNALRLHAIPVRTLIDIPDMVWLQLVRIGILQFYEWTEEYLTEVAAVANGARVSDGAAQHMVNRLLEIITGENLDVIGATLELSEILPGLDTSAGPPAGEQLRIFHNVRGNALAEFVAAKRLGSPQHYRYYYAFERPAGALSDDHVQSFIGLAEHAPNDAIRFLTDLAAETRPQGGTMAEVLIDRLISISERVPARAIEGILASFARTMDDIALSSPTGDFGEHTAWRSAEQVVKRLLRRVAGIERERCVRTLFEHERALGWLTSILRAEIFSHGHYGDRTQPEDQRLLTAAEFTEVLSIMLDRYREASNARLMGVPDLMSLLYAWRQGGDPEEPRRWVNAQVETDAGLLAFLSRVRGWAAATGVGIYHPLKRSDLENFLNYEDALRRVKVIASSSDASEADRQRASELLTAFEQGEDK
jgi:predicted KAP-like P-loop ATPase